MKFGKKINSGMRSSQWWVAGVLRKAKAGKFLSNAYAHCLPVVQTDKALIDLAVFATKAFSVSNIFVSKNIRQDFILENAVLAEQAEMAAADEFSLWANVSHDSAWILSLKETLKRCALLVVSIREGEIVAFVDAVLAQGLEPVVRTEAVSGKFQILFMRKTALADPRFSSFVNRVRAAIHETDCKFEEKHTVPILIPSFNNPTYCKMMIEQLHYYGLKDVTLLDNASTSLEMRRFLDEVADVVSVRHLGENLGPKKCLFAPGVYDSLPRYFGVTDPDIVFNQFLPMDFVSQMI